jgi:hypothetical protein
MPSLVALLLAAAPPPRPYFPPAYREPEFVCNLPDGQKSPPVEIMDAVTDEFLSRIFRDADEPSLYLASLRPRPAGVETLRFTWAGTGHTPVIVRIEFRGGKARLIAKQLTRGGRHARAGIERDVERPLTAAESAALRARLARTHIFDRDLPSCDIVIDGSLWAHERVDARGYHIAQRWIPEDGEHRQLAMFLLGLTGWKLKPVS